MGILEEGGVRAEHRRDDAETAVAIRALQQIGAEEPAEWAGSQIPGAGAPAPVVQIFGTPAGVTVHLVELMAEVAIGMVQQRLPQLPRIGHGLEPLVHAAVDVAPLA